MAESAATRRLAWHSVFVALALLVAFVRLLPLGDGSGGVPGPDLLVALTLAWAIRRPDYVPILLVAAVMLVADFLFMRPPGLWAAITVLGVEFLRNRETAFRDLPFLVEWGTVALLMLAMTLANGFVLLVLMVDQPTLGLTLLQLIATILAYPLVVAVTVFAFGLRRVAPGEVDDMGHRL
jgi:rod shape-determining protein MreD